MAAAEKRRAGEICRVGLAQIAPVLGDVGANLAIHKRFIAEARDRDVDLLVFPELGLTGYFLRDVVPEVALARDAPEIAQLVEAAGDMGLVLGFVEEDTHHRFFNSALLFEHGSLCAAHRKVYLPTYGMFDEQRYFAAGERVRAFDTAFGRVGLLICEDVWHLSCGVILNTDLADTVIVISSSPGRGVAGKKLASADHWETLLSIYARYFGFSVMFCNRAGFEDGVGFWGASQVLAPGGDRITAGPLHEEGLVVAEIDRARLRRQRIDTPLLRDEKLHVTHRELKRIWDETRDQL